MSRIGKKPVPVPNGVSATVSGQTVTVKGPKGELSFTCPDLIAVEKSADGVAVSMREDSKTARSLWGMSRTQIVNLIEGVTKGYKQTLENTGDSYSDDKMRKYNLQG